MAARYEILKDYLGLDQSDPLPKSPDSFTLTPYWVLAVYRYRQPVSFSRRTMKSVSATPDEGVRLAGDGPLIITSDCIQLQVGSNKSSYTGGLNAELLQGNVNYLAELLPGDWCAAWICANEEAAQAVISKLQNKQSANAFMDGLKFLGRLTSIRKELRITPQGLKTSMYTLQASSFKEFDAVCYFDPYLNENNSEVAQYMAKLNKPISDLLLQGEQGVTINKVIPFILDLLLGTGVPPSISHAGGVSQPGAAEPDAAPPPQVVTGLTTSEGSAPYSYLIPQEVGQIVGKVSSSKSTGIISAADLNDVLFGIQNYRSGANSGSSILRGAPEAMFACDNVTASGSRRYTNTPMLGLFLPDVPQFSDQPVWSILTQYLNPVCNEMFATLKTNELGAIVPTVVVRQIPFSTVLLEKYLDNNGIVLPITRFLELPRWNVDPLLVLSASVGRSDSLKFNFIHTFGSTEVSKISNPITFQIVLNPPLRDDTDIKRNGLRPLQQTVAVASGSVESGESKKWMLLSADSHMGMEMVLTGTLNIFGVQAPICIGDNAEFDGVVYHIEAVLHSCQIDTNSGQRSFFTTLQVSHGCRSDTDVTVNPDTQLDIDLFAGMYQSDNTDFDPGITKESFDSAVPASNLRAPVNANSAASQDALSNASVDVSGSV